MPRNTFVIDLDRCIGCKGCQVACKLENGVALGPGRNTVYQVGPTGTYPQVQMYFLPVLCQQCENPACMAVCPTGACHREGEEGIVLIDPEQCISCGSCRDACPYGVIQPNRELRVMDKCTTCLASRRAGDEPACVRNCSGSALCFGDLDDPESEASLRLRQAEGHVYQLRDEGDCRPTVRYILRRDQWQDLLPAQLTEVKRGGKG